MLTRPHTHAPNTTVSESTGYRVTNSAIRIREHSIVTFHACSKQVQKDSSLADEVEEQASPLREHCQTLLLPPRWWPRSC